MSLERIGGRDLNSSRMSSSYACILMRHYATRPSLSFCKFLNRVKKNSRGYLPPVVHSEKEKFLHDKCVKFHREDLLR